MYGKLDRASASERMDNHCWAQRWKLHVSRPMSINNETDALLIVLQQAWLFSSRSVRHWQSLEKVNHHWLNEKSSSPFGSILSELLLLTRYHSRWYSFCFLFLFAVVVFVFSWSIWWDIDGAKHSSLFPPLSLSLFRFVFSSIYAASQSFVLLPCRAEFHGNAERITSTIWSEEHDHH